MTRISIVTPSYNQGEFLERTLKSVLDQKYPDLEYMVMDGGSTDGSVEIIRQYADQLAYWESVPDRGQAHAINKGFARATGEVFAWLNSDDLYLPGTLARVAACFQNPNVDFVFGQRVEINADDQAVGETHIAVRDPLYFMVYGLAALNQEACFWLARLHRMAGELNPAYTCALDYEFFLRLCALAHGRTLCLNECLGAFRVHAAQISHQADAVRRNMCETEKRRARAAYLSAHPVLAPRLWLGASHISLVRMVQLYGWRGIATRFHPRRWLEIVRERGTV